MQNHKNTLDELYQAYLANVYTQTSLVQPTQQFKVRRVTALGNLTYGEMLYPSVKKVLKKLEPPSNSIFLDLGSGLGKFVLQVFMQTSLSKVIGIEFRSELSELSNKAVQFVHRDFPFFWEKNRELKMIAGDFLKEDWEGANIVYACSTCFRPELLVAIGDRINQVLSVQQVLTLRPLPTLERLTLKEVFTVECSWDSALCYWYSL